VPRRRRGYPLALLISLDGLNARFWNIYSESIKPDRKLSGEDSYNFYESVVDEIRPRVKKGIKTVLIASEEIVNFESFMEHVNRHQSWLVKGYELNTVSFEYLSYRAENVNEVRELIKNTGFVEKIEEASKVDIQQVMMNLESRVNTVEGIETLLFTLSEIENTVYSEKGKRPEYILMTEDFQRKHRRRTNRLLQIARNKEIKTNIVKSESKHGKRISQFGGIICVLRK
jgi:stalled ribosome rescue protein Dom34